jgi:hypothetical protein
VHIAEGAASAGDNAAAQAGRRRQVTLPNSRFTIAFLRGGEVLDVRPAQAGERAVKVVLLMLAGMDGLQGGDQLVAREDWDGRTRPAGRVQSSRPPPTD